MGINSEVTEALKALNGSKLKIEFTGASKEHAAAGEKLFKLFSENGQMFVDAANKLDVFVEKINVENSVDLSNDGVFVQECAQIVRNLKGGEGQSGSKKYNKSLQDIIFTMTMMLGAFAGGPNQSLYQTCEKQLGGITGVRHWVESHSSEFSVFWNSLEIENEDDFEKEILDFFKVKIMQLLPAESMSLEDKEKALKDPFLNNKVDTRDVNPLLLNEHQLNCLVTISDDAMEHVVRAGIDNVLKVIKEHMGADKIIPITNTKLDGISLFVSRQNGLNPSKDALDNVVVVFRTPPQINKEVDHVPV